MCGGPEQLNSNVSYSDEVMTPSFAAMSGRPANSRAGVDSENEDHISHLLELAAGNDLEGFEQVVKKYSVKVNDVGSWYGRCNGTTMMVWDQRTPAMMASLFGSVEVLKYILSSYNSSEDINTKYGRERSTALHCAAAGGSSRAIETVMQLLEFGADLNSTDGQGRKPADVIAPFTSFPHVKAALKDLLEASGSVKYPSKEFLGQRDRVVPVYSGDEKIEVITGNVNVDDAFGVAVSAPSTSSDGSPVFSSSPSCSPKSVDVVLGKEADTSNEKSKEYPVDPSIPDIKNSLYMTDEFRMFSFKIRPCSRAYSHDWTECPFVHPGENARRRDPRRFHYSCVPCPEFRKGACRRADACEYAHGVFECWLHPAQYRTRLCKDGTDCTRRVCFFAHTNDELRPLYISSGSAIPCSRTATLDMLNLSPPLCPGSPSSALMMNALSASSAQGSLTTPPMSPSSSPGNSLVGVARSPSIVPSLHLPGVNMQASRLRSALNARDISLEDYGRASDFDGMLVNEVASLASHARNTQARMNAAMSSSPSSRYKSLGLMVSPTNLEDLFTSDSSSSPMSLGHDTPLISHMEGPIPSHKSSLLSGHALGKLGSPGITPMPDPYIQLQQAVALDALMQGSPRVHSRKQMPAYSLSSPGGMLAPCTLGGLGVDLQTGPLGCVAPGRSDFDVQALNGGSLLPSVVAARAAFAERDKRSHSSRDLGAGYLVSDWGSPTGKPEWGVHREELSKFQKFQKSASFGPRQTEEPDLSWVQSIVKDGPADGDNGVCGAFRDESISHSSEALDHMGPGSWIESIQLDEIVA